MLGVFVFAHLVQVTLIKLFFFFFSSCPGETKGSKSQGEKIQVSMLGF